MRIFIFSWYREREIEGGMEGAERESVGMDGWID